MGMDLVGLVAAMVVALDIWAIISVAGSQCAAEKKWKWALVILLLPFAGFLAWVLAGPRQVDYRL